MNELLAKPRKEPRVVLFDMDGVLVDSMPVHAETWYATAVRYGLEAQKEEFYNYEGMKGSDTIKVLYRRTYGQDPDPALVQEIYEYKSGLFLSYQGEMPPIAGASELMSELNGRGIEIGVVTGSTIHNARPRIEKYYSDFVSLNKVVTADMVEKGKPFPDPYLMGVSLFGCSNDEVLAVENAPLGVRSSRAAGLFTAAVMTGPIPKFTLRAEGANLIFRNMRALLSWWVSSFK